MCMKIARDNNAFRYNYKINKYIYNNRPPIPMEGMGVNPN